MTKGCFMKEALLFDFGGTLDADGVAWCERMFWDYRAQGGHLDEEAFEAFFQRSDRMLETVPGIETFGFRRLVRSQTELLRDLLPDGGTMDPVSWGERFVAQASEYATRNRALLAELRSRYPLGVISNFSGNLRPCLEELGLDACFTVVLDSAEVGLRKPDERIFRFALAALGVDPDRCWMVGDNPFADIEPANRLGCRTCWVAPVARATPPGIEPTTRLASLADFPAVVG